MLFETISANCILFSVNHFSQRSKHSFLVNFITSLRGRFPQNGRRILPERLW